MQTRKATLLVSELLMVLVLLAAAGCDVGADVYSSGKISAVRRPPAETLRPPEKVTPKPEQKTINLVPSGPQKSQSAVQTPAYNPKDEEAAPTDQARIIYAPPPPVLAETTVTGVITAIQDETISVKETEQARTSVLVGDNTNVVKADGSVGSLLNLEKDARVVAHFRNGEPVAYLIQIGFGPWPTETPSWRTSVSGVIGSINENSLVINARGHGLAADISDDTVIQFWDGSLAARGDLQVGAVVAVLYTKGSQIGSIVQIKTPAG